MLTIFRRDITVVTDIQDEVTSFNPVFRTFLPMTLADVGASAGEGAGLLS